MKLHPNWTLRRKLNQLLLACFSILAISTSQADSLSFSSGSKQTQLIELYTSEGCSSCPPADRWLTKLKNEPALWRDFVPVAFHVDYWDYIGWPDRFAKPSHAARQRQHAKLGNVKTVYTPGFVINGAEWRGWFRGQTLPTVFKETGPLAAILTENELSITYTPTDTHPQMIATVAILGADDTSNVVRGENANKTLEHDFAVLSQQSISLDYLGAVKAFKTTSTIALPENAKAIAVWVTPRADLRPIQATGAWLAGN